MNEKVIVKESEQKELTPTPMRPGQNGGLLRSGNPGGKGNTSAVGRPKSEVRTMCLDGFSSRLDRLNGIMDDILANPEKLESAAARADLIKIMDMNAKYSGLASIEVDHTATVQVSVVYDDDTVQPELPSDVEDTEGVEVD